MTSVTYRRQEPALPLVQMVTTATIGIDRKITKADNDYKRLLENGWLAFEGSDVEGNNPLDIGHGQSSDNIGAPLGDGWHSSAGRRPHVSVKGRIKTRRQRFRE